MVKIERFNQFDNILYIFDFDDTLVESPSFEDIAIKYINENITVKELLDKSLSSIKKNKKDLKLENGRLYINDPTSEIEIKGNWVRKGPRVYLTSPDIFCYIDESMPSTLKKMSELYKSVENKCIVTARPESLRNKIENILNDFGLEKPKYGLHMKPDNLKNAGDWKGHKICEVVSEFNFSKAIFYDDNSKFIRKAKKVVSEKLPNLDFTAVKVD